MILLLIPSLATAAQIGFRHVETVAGYDNMDRSAEYAARYRSTAIPLDSGRVVLSDPATTPLAMPQGEWWWRGMTVEVIDAHNQSVPLTEVYLHHIAVYDGSKGADLCGGANLDSRDSFWDVGAESRGTRTFLPDGFGYWVAEGTNWTANIHLIRSDGVGNVKKCIECSQIGGSEDYCSDGVLCPGMSYDDIPSKDYFVEYTVYYDVRAQVEPVTYHTLDATACQLEFNVPAVCPWSFHHAGVTVGSTQFEGMGLLGSGRYFPFDFLLDDVDDLPPHCIAERTWKLVWDGDDGRLVFGKGHLHIGAIDMALYYLPLGTNYSDVTMLLCRVEPAYGTTNNWPNEQVPGDEKGYVVGISNCDDAFAQMPVLHKGDALMLQARYRAQPWYDGVMALFDIALAPLANAKSPESA